MYRERGPFDSRFERGYVPMDEPGGFEEREYADWKAAGGVVLPQWSPGPWRVSGHCPAVLSTGGTAVADCRTVDTDGVTQAANARLIAAAPDLLASLKAVIAAWVGEASLGDGILECNGPTLESARAAISKAEGRA